ncbi:hypothetical protein [Streptomyces sp. R41]|uniref:Uncharacterized protein n=1 Tax=Streptomyces sp. R41 TaxID=3238632 RepID=A0AB39R9I5_9ACTN
MAHHTFPDDLVEAQRDWNRTYEALARRNPARTRVLRRQLLELSRQLVGHPFWSTTAGSSRTAWAELRREARAQPESEGS